MERKKHIGSKLKDSKMLNDFTNSIMFILGIGYLLLIGIIPFVTCRADFRECKQLSFFDVVKFRVSFIHIRETN